MIYKKYVNGTNMKITILTDNPNSWIIPYISELKNDLNNHTIEHVFTPSEIVGGDIMLVLSCEKILKPEVLKLHKSNVVVHPSKVPLGKGWSPLAWQVVDGFNNIPVSLFEAAPAVDSGDVYIIDYIKLKGHELNDEIKHQQGVLTIKMVKKYIDEFETMIPMPQIGKETFYPRRNKKENELDVNKTIAEQFNLLRVVDNERYPAHFKLNGHTYVLKIEKLK
tara:strand:+ start:246 stop:911 length:666 start_codon:yes stop_codon:yes gene_type:complete